MKFSLLTLLSSVYISSTLGASTIPLRGVPNPEEYVNTLTGTQSRYVNKVKKLENEREISIIIIRYGISIRLCVL